MRAFLLHNPEEDMRGIETTVQPRATAMLTSALVYALAAWSIKCFGIKAAYLLMRFRKMPPQAARASWDIDEARALATLVDRAAWSTEPQSWCLTRSLALGLMLRLRGKPAQLIIGIRPLPLAGHAWIELGGVVVNDDERVKFVYKQIDAL
ncbi:lasso peptide biosynthesis B2 protein [Luteitalea sp.]